MPAPAAPPPWEQTHPSSQPSNAAKCSGVLPAASTSFTLCPSSTALTIAAPAHRWQAGRMSVEAVRPRPAPLLLNRHLSQQSNAVSCECPVPGLMDSHQQQCDCSAMVRTAACEAQSALLLTLLVAAACAPVDDHRPHTTLAASAAPAVLLDPHRAPPLQVGPACRSAVGPRSLDQAVPPPEAPPAAEEPLHVAGNVHLPADVRVPRVLFHGSRLLQTARQGLADHKLSFEGQSWRAAQHDPAHTPQPRLLWNAALLPQQY